MTAGTQRATPFYCPYCADEDLRPVEEPASPPVEEPASPPVEEPASPPAVEAVTGAWRCTSCLRVFVVRFVGLAPRTEVAP